ncbi:oxidoreductase [Streptomyces sp. NPDC054813]
MSSPPARSPCSCSAPRTCPPRRSTGRPTAPTSRTDAYGGSITGRIRFAVEVAEAVRQAIGEGLEDKVFIVTGGGSGIGAVTVRRLPAEGARITAAGADPDDPRPPGPPSTSAGSTAPPTSTSRPVPPERWSVGRFFAHLLRTRRLVRDVGRRSTAPKGHVVAQLPAVARGGVDTAVGPHADEYGLP